MREWPYYVIRFYLRFYREDGAKKGGIVTGANSDKWPPPNRAGSEPVAQKTCQEMNRVPSLALNPNHIPPSLRPRGRLSFTWGLAGDRDLTPISAGIRLPPASGSLPNLDQPGAVHDTRYPPPFGYGPALYFFDVHRHIYGRRAGDVAAHAERVGSRSR